MFRWFLCLQKQLFPSNSFLFSSLAEASSTTFYPTDINVSDLILFPFYFHDTSKCSTVTGVSFTEKEEGVCVTLLMMISSVRKKEKTGSFSSSSNFSPRNKGLSSGEASGDLSCLQSKMNEESMEEESSLCPPPLTFLTKEPVKRARLIDINEWITCYLCGGYLVDATTLIDCSTLHSFCRSCILKYLNECQVSRTRPTCPVCETALNESKPHSSLRLDRKLQDIVYKLVPGLFKSKSFLFTVLFETDAHKWNTFDIDSLWNMIEHVFETCIFFSFLFSLFWRCCFSLPL